MRTSEMPPAKKEEEAVELSALGTKIRAVGAGAGMVLAVVAAVALILASLYRHEDSQASTHKGLASEHETIKEGISEMTYVMSLTDEQRAKLKLDMPPSLRKKMKGE